MQTGSQTCLDPAAVRLGAVQATRSHTVKHGMTKQAVAIHVNPCAEYLVRWQTSVKSHIGSH